MSTAAPASRQPHPPAEGSGTTRLADLLPQAQLESSAARGIDPEWVEDALFARLALARLKVEPGNAPTVTGARQAAPLGGVYFGTGRH